MSQKSLEQRIFTAYEGLSASERQLADLMLEHQQNLSSYTALELSAMAKVSNATAARLIRKLGYESMGDARRQVRSNQHWGSPLDRIEEHEVRSDGASIARMANSDIANLKTTVERIDAGDLQRAVEVLRNGKRIWIWGVRHGFGVAHIARHYFGFAVSDVRVIPSGSSLGDDFASLQEGDALVVIAFRRRPENLKVLLSAAARVGVSIIMIADTSAVRTEYDVDVVLRCWCNSPAVFTSLTASLSVINYLAWALLGSLGKKGLCRLQSMEDMLLVADNLAGETQSRIRHQKSRNSRRKQ